MKWFLIDQGLMDGAWNMAFDEALFRYAVRENLEFPILRLYGFSSPTITIGYAQRGVDKWKEKGLPFHRRVTGGGTVYHGTDLTYSVVAPNSAHPLFGSASSSYKLFHEVIRELFLRAGHQVELCESYNPRQEANGECFLHPVQHDLLYDGRKVAGAAERRSHGYFLHQGSIELKYFLKTTSEYTDFFIRMKKLAVKSFKSHFGCIFERILLDHSVRDEIHSLYIDKYQSSLWNEQCRSSSLAPVLNREVAI